MKGAADEPGRRALKKTETRQAFRNAAFALFAERGFAETRVADIAAACEVSERTFFRYFSSKEDVALYALQRWLEDLFDAIETLPDTYPPMDAIAAVFRQADAGRFPFGTEQGRDVVAYVSYPEVREHFMKITDRLRLRLIADFARRTGTTEDDPYPRVLASVTSAGLFSVMESWLGSARGDNPWVFARETIARVALEFSKADLSGGAR